MNRRDDWLIGLNSATTPIAPHGFRPNSVAKHPALDLADSGRDVGQVTLVGVLKPWRCWGKAHRPMLLVTVLPVPHGFQIVVATACQAACYRWSLYRNGHLVQPPTWSHWPDNVTIFVLKEPLAAGSYQVRVRCFRQEGEESQAVFNVAQLANKASDPAPPLSRSRPPFHSAQANPVS